MVDQMLEQLRVRGLTIRADGDRLLVNGNTAELTPEVRAAIARFKPYLLTRLREGRRFDVHHPPPPAERPVPPVPPSARSGAPP